ncbi:cytochrome b5 domain-containing protein [Hymenobacter cellulosilyticus]|uniref:Cytochrome b5 n=1 Tax=Hymenobacter cellulosilyticus TaxID=2932248 RepID=A0A8T9QE06_9BACT|nr:cytochrome b5 domain-containing protein [Hymenobacter cellulosilyticus]UOQ73799.1 cytochrome b5 [Hymenobacter cellulosilyticus]
MNTPTPEPNKQPENNSLPEYTLAQLALRNGQDRDEIWVGYNGLIYDVTRSRLWRRGNHYEHWAGQDLTKELHKDAPHTEHVFDKFHAIGRLKTPTSSVS